MINYIIAGIIGIVIYQIICMIVYIVTNEDDNIMSIMAMLIPFVVWQYGIAAIMRKIILIWCRRNLNVYRCCWIKDDGTVGQDRKWYATNKTVANLTQDETRPYFIKKISDCKSLKSIPYKSEIYKGQSSFELWDMNKFKNN